MRLRIGPARFVDLLRNWTEPAHRPESATPARKPVDGASYGRPRLWALLHRRPDVVRPYVLSDAEFAARCAQMVQPRKLWMVPKGLYLTVGVGCDSRA